MASIVGQDEKAFRRFTCYNCGSIVQYVPCEEYETGETDDGTKIKGLNCPRCHEFHRTNP